MPSAMEVAGRNLLRKVGVEVVPTRRRAAVSLLGLHLSRLFAVHRVEVVLDVGARVGEYGTFLRQNGYTGWIVSFEPVGDHFAHLERRAAHDPRWAVHRCALGDTDGSATINVTAMSELSSMLPAIGYGATVFADSAAVERTETIEVRTLDSMWGSLPRGRTYLKLDTQGYDLRVLAGAERSLLEVVGLQTEASVIRIYDGAPSHVETIRAVEALGFTPSGMFPVSLDHDDMRLVEYDLVAVRALEVDGKPSG